MADRRCVECGEEVPVGRGIVDRGRVMHSDCWPRHPDYAVKKAGGLYVATYVEATSQRSDIS